VNVNVAVSVEVLEVPPADDSIEFGMEPRVKASRPSSDIAAWAGFQECG
jgi:hypothetical protein